MLLIILNILKIMNMADVELVSIMVRHLFVGSVTIVGMFLIGNIILKKIIMKFASF